MEQFTGSIGRQTILNPAIYGSFSGFTMELKRSTMCVYQCEPVSLRVALFTLCEGMMKARLRRE